MPAIKPELRFIFYETFVPNFGLFYVPEKYLLYEKTPYQTIEVFEHPYLGRVLALDGAVMVTEKEEFVYHEMITHVPIVVSEGKIRKVLVIGGGDGGTVREVLKFPFVEEVEMVEIDKRVIEVSKQFFPSIATSFDDERLKLHIDDGIRFVERMIGIKQYDLIIIDSSDPVGPAVGLFRENFYRNCKKLLSDDGIFVAQIGNALFPTSYTKDVMKVILSLYRYGFPYTSATPTYGGLWLLLFASDKYHPTKDVKDIFSKWNLKAKYYNYWVHKGAFYLPDYLLEEIGIRDYFYENIG
jgi:spermidine synthase